MGDKVNSDYDAHVKRGRDNGAGVSSKARPHFRRGLVIATLGGLGAPLMSIGIQYGTNLLSGTASGQWVAWALFLSAASITQSGYCFFRVWQRRGWAEYLAAPAASEWIRIGVMAVVWAASIALYAFSIAALGPLGTSVGWPIFIGVIVVTSNAWGLVLREWRGKAPGSARLMLSGSLVLIGATFLVAQGR
jgi:L-rhamnose-H+ transport protein